MAKRGRPKKVSEVIEDEGIMDEISENGNASEPKEENNENSNQDDFQGTQNHHNPFKESVVERDYSTPKVAQGEVEDIGEPSFIPPSYEDIVQDRQGESMDDGYNENPFDNPNPALNDLEGKDKKIACESLVDTCLDAYEQLHKYAQHIVKVDEDELMQKQAEDKIDLEQIIPVTEQGDSMSVGEFIGQFNQQSQQALKYDQDFGFKVRPAMIRVFMKKGWGMSDEQFLMYMFGKDIAIKVGIMYQLKKSINSTLSTLEKAHKRQKRQNRGFAEVEQEDFPSEPINDNDDDEFDFETEPINDKEEIVEEIKVEQEKDTFSESMDINMPQNPKNPLSQHPKEVRKELGRKRVNKKKN
jgi:hypothetical protein